MSAPTTHDPRFVNTKDGVCWERRAVTDSGLGLYAVEGSCKCPPFKMATFVELAAHGIAEWADARPVKVGPQLSELETLRARVAELEAERHSTNEALDDAVQALRARQSCLCPPADQPGPHQFGCPLAEVPRASERPVNELTAVYMPVAALREDVSPQVEKLRALLAGQRGAVEDPHDSPLHRDYRVGHDLPETGGAS